MKKNYAITFGILMAVQFLTAQTTTLNFTGSVQTFTVPPCVGSIQIEVSGARGQGGNGGNGGYSKGLLSVIPGQVYNVYVGGQNGYNGGGNGWANSPRNGGGASDVRFGGTSLTDRIIVAGGGGSSSGDGNYTGGTGGGGTASGNYCGGGGGSGYSGSGGPGGLNGGTGITACHSGGAGGGGFMSGGVASCNTCYTNSCGTAGTLGTGGNGDTWENGVCYNSYGGTSGGGGGYYGGGGSSVGNCGSGGGGGGSSWTGTLTSPQMIGGNCSGDGIVIITIMNNSAPPAAPGVITGSSSVCANATGNYSIVLVPNATTYTWTVPVGSVINSGQGTNTINATFGSSSGNITVTAGNTCGTSAASTFVLTISPSPPIAVSSNPASFCSVGTSTLTASGSTNYVWMPGNLTGATVVVSPTTTTTYTVTGTNSQGCISTATTTVTVNPLPVVTATSSAASVCVGGSVTLNGGGASSYTWNNNVMNAISFVPTATTTYMVTGTDANGCVNTAMTTVTVNPLPVITATSSAAVVCAGASVTLTGGGAATYTWDNNVTDTVSFVPMATTTYIVTGTDANGCVNTATTTVTVNALPVVTATSTAAAVCIGASVTLTGGGAVTYVWDNNVMDTVSFVPTATTTYMVTGTDANGCVNTAMTTVTVNPLPIVTANSSAASVCTGGSVTLTGGGASTYTWDNNVIDAVSFVPTATTTYMVTGTDANGCVNTATTTVTLSGLLTVSLGPDIIQCGGTAMLDAGNTGSIYLWSDLSTSQTLTVSTSGTYIVVVTNVNGCMGSDSAVVTINSNPTVTASASSVVVCVADAIVTLTGTPTGGVWSGPGVNGLLFSPTAAGVGLQSAVYSYTDVNGCEGMDSVSIQVNACVGLAENILANGVSVYPNPNNGNFTLGVSANVDELVIKITDIQGRVVYASVDNKVNAGFVKQISLDSQPSGMYLMQILANGEQQTKKISVQK